MYINYFVLHKILKLVFINCILNQGCQVCWGFFFTLWLKGLTLHNLYLTSDLFFFLFFLENRQFMITTVW